MRPGLVAAALGLVVAAAAAAAPAAAPDELTLAVRPGTTNWGKPILVSGVLATRRADQKVTVQFKQCGSFPREFRDAAETTTGAGGTWSVEWLFGRGGGSYRAVSGAAVSAEAVVQGRPSVLLRRDRTGFDVWVTAALPFYKKRALVQRLDERRGGWVTVRSVLLTEQLGNHPQFGLPLVSTGRKNLRLRVARGSTLRAVLPLAQARPCYLAGYSNILRA